MKSQLISISDAARNLSIKKEAILDKAKSGGLPVYVSVRSSNVYSVIESYATEKAFFPKYPIVYLPLLQSGAIALRINADQVDAVEKDVNSRFRFFDSVVIDDGQCTKEFGGINRNYILGSELAYIYSLREIIETNIKLKKRFFLEDAAPGMYIDQMTLLGIEKMRPYKGTIDFFRRSRGEIVPLSSLRKVRDMLNEFQNRLIDSIRTGGMCDVSEDVCVGGLDYNLPFFCDRFNAKEIIGAGSFDCYVNDFLAIKMDLKKRIEWRGAVGCGDREVVSHKLCIYESEDPNDLFFEKGGFFKIKKPNPILIEESDLRVFWGEVLSVMGVSKNGNNKVDKKELPVKGHWKYDVAKKEAEEWLENKAKGPIEGMVSGCFIDFLAAHICEWITVNDNESLPSVRVGNLLSSIEWFGTDMAYRLPALTVKEFSDGSGLGRAYVKRSGNAEPWKGTFLGYFVQVWFRNVYKPMKGGKKNIASKKVGDESFPIKDNKIEEFLRRMLLREIDFICDNSD